LYFTSLSSLFHPEKNAANHGNQNTRGHYSIPGQIAFLLIKSRTRQAHKAVAGIPAAQRLINFANAIASNGARTFWSLSK